MKDFGGAHQNTIFRNQGEILYLSIFIEISKNTKQERKTEKENKGFEQKCPHNNISLVILFLSFLSFYHDYFVLFIFVIFPFMLSSISSKVLLCFVLFFCYFSYSFYSFIDIFYSKNTMHYF